jgi:hypothetical protein
MQATPDGPAGYNGFPNTAVLTPANNTAYIVNVGGGAGALMNGPQLLVADALSESTTRAV